MRENTAAHDEVGRIAGILSILRIGDLAVAIAYEHLSEPEQAIAAGAGLLPVTDEESGVLAASLE
ncbi:MAG: hypothetical protein ABIQ30_06735 [Devosia sp.]